MKLLNVVSPDSLLEWIPLGLGRGVDGSKAVGSKRTGSSHPMKAIPGVEIRANQVAQQVHVHPSDEKVVQNMSIDRIHSSMLLMPLRDSFRLLSIICQILSDFADARIRGNGSFYSQRQH